MRRPRLTLGVAAAAIAAGGIVAAVIPTSTAVAFLSPPLMLQVTVSSPATLIANGVAMHVPVTYSCSGTAYSTDVFVSVSENVGSQITVASGSAAALCNGKHHAMTVTVYGQTASNAFRKGTALATANLNGCTKSFCANQIDARIISIT